MLKIIVYTNLIFLVGWFVGCQRQDPSKTTPKQLENKQMVANDGKSKWPPLPTNGFIAGRAATLDDMKAGRAVFTLGGKALDLEIPQYGIHVSEETKQRTPGIIVQAELSADGKMSVVGMKKIENGEIVGLLREFVLLGKTPPRDE
jgi:hypothetical protein